MILVLHTRPGQRSIPHFPDEFGPHWQPVSSGSEPYETPSHYLISLGEQEPSGKSRGLRLELEDIPARAIDDNTPGPRRVVCPDPIPASIQVPEAGIRR